MHEWLIKNLVCPLDHAKVDFRSDRVVCANGHVYPIRDGIPVMIAPADIKVESQVVDEISSYSDSGIDPFVQKVFEKWWSYGIFSKLKIGHSIRELTTYPIPEFPLDLSSGMRILDLGCNWGRWSLAAARKGGLPIGIDVSFESVQAARRIAQQLGLPAEYLVAQAGRLPFRGKIFDAVFSYNTFFYFDKDYLVSSLSEARRVIKSPGQSYIQMANVFGARNLYHQSRRCFRQPRMAKYAEPPGIHNEYYWDLRKAEKLFETFLGPSVVSADTFFCLDAQKEGEEFLPFPDRFIHKFSRLLRAFSRKCRALSSFSDTMNIRSSILP